MAIWLLSFWWLRARFQMRTTNRKATGLLSVRIRKRVSPVQHHRAHIASVLAERGEWEKRVVGVSFDGTGYGDDGSIWGGEIFVDSLKEGFDRVGHLRKASLPGGDAAAQYPVQAAAGFLAQVETLPDLTAPPFSFSPRYLQAVDLVEKRVRDRKSVGEGKRVD